MISYSLAMDWKQVLLILLSPSGLFRKSRNSLVLGKGKFISKGIERSTPKVKVDAMLNIACVLLFGETADVGSRPLQGWNEPYRTREKLFSYLKGHEWSWLGKIGKNSMIELGNTIRHITYGCTITFWIEGEREKEDENYTETAKVFVDR